MAGDALRVIVGTPSPLYDLRNTMVNFVEKLLEMLSDGE